MSGFVDAHCHLWIEPGRGVGGPRLADEAAALAELRAFREAGGVMVVDCQPGGCGRDGNVLARLTRESGIEIVAATGYHLRRYYPDGDSPYDAGAAPALDRWLRELARGLVEDSWLRARVVKSAWTGEEEGERELMLAAAEAARRSFVPLVVHTERGARVEELAALLAGTGIDPGRVQISHVDKRPDVGLHRELAEAGFVLGYDTWLRERYRPEENVWSLVRTMAEDGYAPRITVGLDLVDAAEWSVSGAAGLPSIPRAIAPRLEAELGQAAADALCGGNALRMHGRVGVAL